MRRHEKEKGNGIPTYFIKAKLSQAIRGEPGLIEGGGYFSLPFEVKSRIRKTQP